MKGASLDRSPVVMRPRLIGAALAAILAIVFAAGGPQRVARGGGTAVPGAGAGAGGGSRAQGTVTFPANFMLAGAMNPWEFSA
jgi:hypothetical protein